MYITRKKQKMLWCWICTRSTPQPMVFAHICIREHAPLSGQETGSSASQSLSNANSRTATGFPTNAHARTITHTQNSITICDCDAIPSIHLCL